MCAYNKGTYSPPKISLRRLTRTQNELWIVPRKGIYILFMCAGVYITNDRFVIFKQDIEGEQNYVYKSALYVLESVLILIFRNLPISCRKLPENRNLPRQNFSITFFLQPF